MKKESEMDKTSVEGVEVEETAVEASGRQLSPKERAILKNTEHDIFWKSLDERHPKKELATEFYKDAISLFVEEELKSLGMDGIEDEAGRREVLSLIGAVSEFNGNDRGDSALREGYKYNENNPKVQQMLLDATILKGLICEDERQSLTGALQRCMTAVELTSPGSSETNRKKEAADRVRQAVNRMLPIINKIKAEAYSDCVGTDESEIFAKKNYYERNFPSDPRYNREHPLKILGFEGLGMDGWSPVYPAALERQPDGKEQIEALRSEYSQEVWRTGTEIKTHKAEKSEATVPDQIEEVRQQLAEVSPEPENTANLVTEQASTRRSYSLVKPKKQGFFARFFGSGDKKTMTRKR